jgi:hypothetical protein
MALFTYIVANLFIVNVVACQVGKEIILQNKGYLHKQTCVYGGFLQYFTKIALVAVDLFC